MRTLIVGLCTFLSLVACKDKTAKEVNEIIRPIHAVQVNAHQVVGVRKFTGRAEASNAVTLAFEVPGKLEKIPVDVGDQVSKGAVLASLDSRDYENTLDQAKAELKRARAQYERMKKAELDNAVSKQDVTDAEAAYESAKAEVNIRQKALNDTKLIAPYSGTVTAKLIKDFGNVQAKQPAIRLVDSTRIEMIADVPEDIISLAEQGMEILVEFDAFEGVTITSTIHEIGKEASESTRTYPVTLIMDQPEGVTILPGMAGKAWREEQSTTDNLPEHLRGFDVPLSAIASVDSSHYVWVINQDNSRVTRVPIQIGEITQKGVLVQGLSGSEFIATAGVNSLVEGQKVRILQTKE